MLFRSTGLPVVVSVPSVPEVMHRALVHTTFASLIDKDVARAFADTAQSVMPHSPGLAPSRLSALPDHPSVAGPEAQPKAEPRSMSRRNARTASNKVTTAAIDDYLGGNVA